MTNSCVILLLFFILKIERLDSHQVYPPVAANVRPIQQVGEPIQPGPPMQHSVATHSGHSRGTTRCYICAWSIALCNTFECYNNPDICTNNNFSPSLVQQADCPAGCEQFVITDPNGIVQQWRRNCAPGTHPIPGFNCRTEYQLGIRVDRCLCNKNWCNSSPNIRSNHILITIFSVITAFILIHFYP